MTAGARSRLTATDRATNARLEQRAADLDAVTITVEAVGHMTHAGELRRPGDRFTATGAEAIRYAGIGLARPFPTLEQPGLPAWWPASAPLPPVA